jgi:hypothetical protein
MVLTLVIGGVVSWAILEGRAHRAKNHAAWAADRKARAEKQAAKLAVEERRAKLKEEWMGEQLKRWKKEEAAETALMKPTKNPGYAY